MTIEIPLVNRRGEKIGVTLISDQDEHLVAGHRWCLLSSGGCPTAKKFYAVSWKKGRPLLLHRLLLSPPRGFYVDHRNGDGLNNTRENIRLCTPQENAWNSSKNSKSKTVEKHIGYNGKSYTVRIAMGDSEKGTRRSLYCKSFRDLRDAIAARDREIARIRGDFAFNQKQKSPDHC